MFRDSTVCDVDEVDLSMHSMVESGSLDQKSTLQDEQAHKRGRGTRRCGAFLPTNPQIRKKKHEQ